MNKPLVFNIQKYSIHDGEGIRTTIFFKGCPLDCKWCHNPESQCYTEDLMFTESRCVRCGACIPACPNQAISFRPAADGGHILTDREVCTSCGECVKACLHEARELAASNRTYEVKDLVKEALKDRIFYDQSGGGVTLSGGEVMAQDMDYVAAVCRRIFNEGCSVDIDTSGYAPYENFQKILPYIDTFLYDIKLMDPQDHKRWVGRDNTLILENLKKLSADGAKINIRLPLIDGVNADDEHIGSVIRFLKENGIRVYKVSLLKYHSHGANKYAKLDRDYDEDSMSVPEEEWLQGVADKFTNAGFNVKIGG